VSPLMEVTSCQASPLLIFSMAICRPPYALLP
jgi:hypothetical protein